MMQIKIYIIILLSLFIFIRCSSDVTKTEKNEKIELKEPVKIEKLTNDLSVNVNGIVCWINSMPGTDKPKFQVSGDLVIPDNKKYNLDEIKIRNVVISQGGNEIYYIRPTQDFNIQKETKTKRIRFSTIKGLNLVAGLNKKKSANIEIIFADNENKFSYYLYNIKIEEAY